MADQTTFPEEADLAALIGSCGVADTECSGFALIDLGAKIEAAIDEWHEGTEWYPFLADPSPSTRYFDPPGPDPSRSGLSLRGGGKKLFLNAGLLSVTSLTISGVALQQGVNFWLRPDNAAAKRKPFTRIDFAAPVFGTPQSVAVTGVWGYWGTLRNSVFQAVLQRAASLCVPELALGISGGVYKQDDVQYGGGGGLTPLSAEKAMWDRYFEATVEDFDRPTI